MLHTSMPPSSSSNEHRTLASFAFPPSLQLNTPMAMHHGGGGGFGHSTGGGNSGAQPVLTLESHGASTVGPVGGLTGELLDANVALVNTIRAHVQQQSHSQSHAQQQSRTSGLEDNAVLLGAMRDNIVEILNIMNHSPGVMSQMPQLPVSLNLNLADMVLPPRSNKNNNTP